MPNKDKKKKRTLEDYLIERIKKSGYPLEIELSNLLDIERYVVFNTRYYFDEDEKQGRDIDIYAMPLESHPLEEKLAPFNVRTELVIECKKSDTHAWIFYTRPSIPVSYVYMSGQYITSVPELSRFSSESFHWQLKQRVLFTPHSRFERIAVAYEEIKKAKAGKGGSSRKEIFEAVSQLVKFTCYELHQIHRRISQIARSDLEHIIVLFPVVVFDGDMFEVRFDSGEPRPEKKNHILLATQYRCPYRQEVVRFAVDIVHRSYFREFLQTARICFFEIRERIMQNLDELIKRAEDTRAAKLKEGLK